MFDPEFKTISGPLKSRWSRVERKALVFFPTLNERLCFQRTIPAASLPTRALVARESSRAPRLLPRLSVCDFSRGMSIYMQVIFRNRRICHFLCSKQVEQLHTFKQRFRRLF